MKTHLLLLFTIMQFQISAQTTVIGMTKYDLQTFGAVRNMVSVNPDGSISACWNFSPDANNSSQPPYPYLGAAYNYWDPVTGWQYPFPGVPISAIYKRTELPSIVVTPSGREMIIDHALCSDTTHTQIVIHWRPVKGTGNWSVQTRWDTTQHFAYSKACGAVTSENVYAMWVNDTIFSGGLGRIYFSKSTDGGQTWTTAVPISQLNTYVGFRYDTYSIDAMGDTVAIVAGDYTTDLVLLKSVDAGNSWTSTIIQKHPIPLFTTCGCPSEFILNGSNPDTLRSNSGDAEILVDNSGICHVWFSAYNYAGTYFLPEPTRLADNLYYWNESMGADTTTVWDSLTGGHGSYVAITHAEDLNGNGILDLPTDTFVSCTQLSNVGEYRTGITQMPSAGINSNGRIYISYSTVNELADTANYHMAHRHVYQMYLDPPYNPASWSVPQNIIEMQSQGGDGENEECVYASMARTVHGDTASLIYQADAIPGISIFPIGSCQTIYNLNVPNQIRFYGNTNLTTDVRNINSENNFENPFPNPCSNQFTISVNLKNQSTIKIELYDIAGKLLHSQIQSCNSGNNILKISVADFSNGIYFCSLINDNTVISKKFIIQK